MHTIWKFLLILMLIHGAVFAQSVVVHWDSLRQTIDGFGASDAWFSDEIMTHPDKDEILDLLFDKDIGAGLSILRHRVPPNQADWIDYQPDLVSGDLDFGARPYNGVRFSGLEIPQGATIDSAWIQFYAKDNLTTASTLTILGEAADDAATFVAEPANISGRNMTTDSVVWNPPPWLDGENGSAQKTPDLRNIIQEIVNREGWTSGNGMVFIIKNLTGKRSASAFERNPDEAAELFIQFDSSSIISKKVIAGTDDAEEFGLSYISYGAQVTREAFARGCEKVWAAAWSPPAVWKTNGILNEGGFLMQEHYQDWADFIENYRSVMDEKSGFPLYGISPQNEPGPKSWESCQWNSGDFRDFIKSNLGPALDPDCRIIVPEETNWNNVDNFYNATHNDPVARGYVDIVAGHVYGGDPDISYNHFGKPVWETEWSYDTSGDNLNIDNGLQWAYNFWRLLVNAEVSACHHWWLVNLQDDGRQQGLISAVPYTEGYTVPKRLWTIGNYSKFVRPGWQRIEATKTPASNIHIATFKNSESNEFAIVAINRTTANTSITFNFNGFSSDFVIPQRTSQTEDLQQLDSIAAGQFFVAQLPAKSITTFIGVGEKAEPENPVLRNISQSSNDASENNTGQVDIAASTLDFGESAYNALCFSGILIPQGAYISEAKIQFTASANDQNEPSQLSIYCQNIDNAKSFSVSSKNISLRVLANEAVTWNIAAWNTVGERNTEQQTPDLKSLVQQIVDRDGWNSGNALVFVFKDSSGLRSAHAFDGDPQNAAELTVSYSLTTPISDNEGDHDKQPSGFRLQQNYPNPFNPVTTISYVMAGTGKVKIEIFDINGRKISTLLNTQQSAGSYSVEWQATNVNGTGISNGVYIYRMTVQLNGKVHVEQKKMLFIK